MRLNKSKVSLGPWVLAAPAMLLLISGLAAPLILLFRFSFYAKSGHPFYEPGTWTTENYESLLGSPYGRGITAFTVLLGIGLASFSVLTGYPIALFICGLPKRLKAAAIACVVLPKLASVLVIVYGLQILLGDTGPVNRFALALGLIGQPMPLTHHLVGAFIGEVYLLFPYAVLVMIAAFDRIDLELVPAARGLGATRWQAFRRITLPLSLPGVFLAGELCLIWGLAAYIGPLFLGGPEQFTLSIEVQRQTFVNFHWPRAAAAAVVMLGVMVACLALYLIPATRLRRKGEPT